MIVKWKCLLRHVAGPATRSAKQPKLSFILRNLLIRKMDWNIQVLSRCSREGELGCGGGRQAAVNSNKFGAHVFHGLRALACTILQRRGGLREHCCQRCSSQRTDMHFFSNSTYPTGLSRSISSGMHKFAVALLTHRFKIFSLPFL